MPILSISRIVSIIDGKLFPNSNHSDDFISSLSIDSRTIFDPESCLFFALKTERNDGHRYISDLVHLGVKAFVVSKFDDEYDKFDRCNFIVVPDTLEALQTLAGWHRAQFAIPVIGITGSNGKTIVKEWLFDLLKNLAVIRSPKSYNSQVGVPLSVWNLAPEHELAIFEAGISKPGEMENLARIIQPTIGILTNIGESHQENFESKLEKLAEKFKLFETCERLIYCQDQNLVNSYLETKKINQPEKYIGWSFNDEKASLYFRKQEFDGRVYLFTEFNGKSYQVTLPFQNEASLENAGHCLAFLLTQGFADESVIKLFENLQPIAMRLEMKEGINECLLINDYYNSDIYSLQIALSFLNNHAGGSYQRKIVILSDIQQAGIPDKQLYREVNRLLQLNKINHLIGIGTEIRKNSVLFELSADFYESTDHFLNAIRFDQFRKDCILLKGARDFHFERISSALQKKYHQTVLEIDLNALIGNLNIFRSAIRPETRIMVMVKAFSYGSGMVEIARILQFHKVDYLAVAVADEGIELRQAGIELPIVVMNPEEHSFENMIEFRLEPNIYSEEIFDSFLKVLQNHAVVRYPIHLKIDTGMHRLGFDSIEKVKDLAEKLVHQEQMVVRSVFSHLAAADESLHDEFTHNQIDQFQKLCSVITDKVPYKILRHILNSAGIERFSEFQFEMVRLGIGLYGVSSTGNDQIKSISRLKTCISQIRTVDAGQSVGYGRKGKIIRKAEIAVLPIGYADGYDRRLSNGVGKVYVKGMIVPVIGNICMDMCMINVTGLNVAVGDEVELMGEHIPVSEIAEIIGTIPYEILTGISQRVKRVYLQE